MKPFETLSAIAAPLALDNVDTDQILPARFMAQRRELGYGGFCLRDLRFQPDGTPHADFVLNLPTYVDARVLVAGSNFGCGSSREGAVYALLDFGLQVVIAESFGDIFQQNALINGLLPVALSSDEVARLQAEIAASPSTGVVVDLEQQAVTTPAGRQVTFAIDPFRKMCLLSGLDEISFTESFSDRIAAYERQGTAGGAVKV